MKHIKLFENYKTPEEFMLDLYNVGKTKAVGYLPYDNIKKYGNDSVENVIKWCEFINKIINSKVEFETDYFDSKSWNFGLDNKGNIKMIDF